ncbi:hypothetical protein [Burkholderia arboris]|uniref:hypothetical protein n=1 Tax=Burkholderia arboris TaxID=488730 RepID=UPI001CF28CD7|nr:hypothetical protein [Burkholderia arboris]MCA8050871.1 hypothetical protein [Burkholderia arboris]HEP6430615.1 hypothetical protein [Burkholderia cenocepacia]
MAKRSVWTEARVFAATAVLCVLVAVVCAITKEWFGVIGSLLGISNALAARSFLVKLKPSAQFE